MGKVKDLVMNVLADEEEMGMDVPFMEACNTIGGIQNPARHGDGLPYPMSSAALMLDMAHGEEGIIPCPIFVPWIGDRGSSGVPIRRAAGRVTGKSYAPSGERRRSRVG